MKKELEAKLFKKYPFNKKEYMKQYAQKHKIKLKKYRRKNYLKNLNKIKEHYQNNKVKFQTRARVYHTTPKGIYYLLKNGSKSRGIQFTLQLPDFINWYTKIEKNCFYCNRSVDVIRKDTTQGNKNKRLGIDRVENNKGYSMDNIVLSCFRCNSIKSNYFTQDEMLEIGKIINRKEF